MSVVDVVLKLPEELVAQAHAAGILTEKRVSEWIIIELERQRSIAELRDDIHKLRALEPALTAEEIALELGR